MSTVALISVKTSLSLLLGAFTCVPQVTPAELMIGQQASGSVETKASFRYLIVKDSPLHDGHIVLVLLDAKSFSEGNLRELFQPVSKRFSKSPQLWVCLVTNLEQLPTPEEEDSLRDPGNEIEFLSNLNAIHKYPWAVYYRLQDSEYFQYSPGPAELKRTVVVSGRTPNN